MSALHKAGFFVAFAAALVCTQASAQALWHPGVQTQANRAGTDVGSQATVAKPLSVYSNFGRTPSQAFNSGSGYVISGSASAEGINSIASWFVPKFNATLTEVSLPLSHDETKSTSARALNITLHADGGAGVPGPVLYTWSNVLLADGVAGIQDYAYVALTSPDSAPAIRLDAGVKYWISVTAPEGSDFRGRWNLPVESQPGTIAYYSKTLGTWAPLNYAFPVMAVYGTRLP